MRKTNARNHYKEPVVKTCDECGKVPESKILWKERRTSWLLCPKCWIWHGNKERYF